MNTANSITVFKKKHWPVKFRFQTSYVSLITPRGVWVPLLLWIFKNAAYHRPNVVLDEVTLDLLKGTKLHPLKTEK